jgi:hypothetical protein
MLSLKIILIACLLPAWLFAEQTLKLTGSQQKCEGDGIRADNSRSDTIDILDYDIHLDILDFTGKSIGGYTSVSFKSKLDGVSQLYLDLLKLHIDSIKQNGQPLSFSYTDSLLLIINLTTAMNTGDASVVTIYYHGKPQVDASGWGGFYFSADYAYNLGVGFSADPHAYGRVWFPCFDNFVERSTYHFSIITTDTKMALCNGALISTIDNGNGTKTWNWEMTDEIPSYLACVAVGSYAPAYFNYYGIEDTIPVQLGAVAADTTDMKNSFVHLTDALSIFENHFGPYRWNKVGYSLVPFTGGAMEHATNIAYPNFMVNGNTLYEDFLVHELSHHWFGDLATCETAEDMWLNEGWASYCVYLFYENEYGKEKYDEEVAANHEAVVHYAHTTSQDGQYFPVSGVPHDYTYGTTVYKKGADMVHTLRSYMGDSMFFSCVTSYLNNHQLQAVSSYDLRDALSACSGIDLTDYFNDWIFSGGFAQFSIDSVQVSPSGNSFAVNVFIRQRLDHAPHYYHSVPLEITFMDDGWNKVTEKTVMSGRCGIYTTTLPFNPIYTGLDLAEKISDAITADTKTIKTTGPNNFVYGKMNLNVLSLPDSAFLRIEHNYAPPDGFKTPVPGLHISDYRYWKVDGILPAGFDATALVNYNGANTTGGGFLDNNLISNVEDSLVILYRATPAFDWQIIADVTQNFLGSHNDKKGNFTINHLQKGEYSLGIFDYTKVDSMIDTGNDSCLYLGTLPIESEENGALKVYPNPSHDLLTVDIDFTGTHNLLEIYNLYGDPVYREKLVGNKVKRNIAVQNWSRGVYLVLISNTDGGKYLSRLVVVN